MQWIEANWVIVLVLVLAVLIGAWLLRGSRGAGERELGSTIDVSPDAPRAASNRDLFNELPTSPLASHMPPVVPDILAGASELVAAAAAREADVADPPVPPEPAPVPEPEVPPSEPTPDYPAPVAGKSAPDDLSRIKGLGPKLHARLNELGVTRFDQIAAWNDADLARIDEQLGNFRGRPKRDNWVEQARLLAANDTAAYEQTFGKL